PSGGVVVHLLPTRQQYFYYFPVVARQPTASITSFLSDGSFVNALTKAFFDLYDTSSMPSITKPFPTLYVITSASFPFSIRASASFSVNKTASSPMISFVE